MFKCVLQALLGYTFAAQESQFEKKMFTEFLLNYDVIKAKNECGEERIIAFEKEPDHELNILVTKCKRLLSFVSKKSYVNDEYMDVLDIHDKIRNAMYKDDDITPLIEEFEHVQKFIKRSSRSFKDLSSAHLL